MPGAAAGAIVVVLAFSSGGYFASDHGLLLLAFALVVLAAALVTDEVRLERRSLAFVAGLAGLALWALASVAWSPASAWPVLEAERGLAYAVAAAALLLVASPTRMASMLGGVAAGATVVAGYSLATRLLPGRVGGGYDPESGYQLAEPIGYSNALGLVLAMGLLLAAGFALRPEAALRAPAGAALVALAAALYLTFSRGAVAAALVGMVVLFVLQRGARGRLAVLALAPSAAVLFAARSPALTEAGHPLESAQAEGRRLAWVLLAVAALGAATAWALPRLAGRARVPPRAGAVALGAVVVLVVVGASAVVARAGGPVALAETAVDAFRKEPPATSGELDRRLLSVSGHGRADYWRVAARMVEREPLLGEGAGGFERRWVEERPVPHNARDAHNLYLETLAELGPVGLACLLVALGVPLTALGRARAAPFVPAATAAYAAFLVHAAVDWDWEVPLLALCALTCAAVLLVAGRTGGPLAMTPARRALGVAAAVVALGVGLVAHVGNRAVLEGAEALERGDVAAALEAARRARTWAPWSHEPWQLLGEVQLAAGNRSAARRSLDEAIARAPEEWSAWLDLAQASTGPRARRAITRARDLNPEGVEILALGHR